FFQQGSCPERYGGNRAVESGNGRRKRERTGKEGKGRRKRGTGLETRSTFRCMEGRGLLRCRHARGTGPETRSTFRCMEGTGCSGAAARGERARGPVLLFRQREFSSIVWGGGREFRRTRLQARFSSPRFGVRMYDCVKKPMESEKSVIHSCS